MLKTTLPSAAQAAGAAHCASNAITHGRCWLLVGMVCLSLAMSASAESLQTEIVEPDASVVSDSGGSQGAWYYGKKGLTYDICRCGGEGGSAK